MGAVSMQLFALPGIPLVKPGDALAGLIVAALQTAGLSLQNRDVLVLAQKIVSKSEGRYLELAGVEPSARALQLARLCNKDPRLVEVILGESREVLRARRDVLVVEHRLGNVLANAGVDASNVGDEGKVLLLPVDPDASCQALRAALQAATGADAGVLINDSWGRAWRMGTTGTALGVAGVPAVEDLRGRPDLFGRKLRSTEVAVADELAAAASLLMGQAGEGHPVVLVRGFPYPLRESSAAELLRPRSLDLFR
ncbi:MAG: coenzyme F420-0:L-glutamate ligase [Betaproteobacteria bacterium RIFCSPLOWO2_02_FULL_62_17]|nr:MAG: coenzyme F420-0:L-glutamate ligase [Betaproteobacteria bacterium RIFCSPLOWO2_02_FULL_62_17]